MVLPAYNERPALAPLIASLVEHLEETQRPFQIVVVNDGSTDGTKETLEELSRTFPGKLHPIHQAKNKGLADTMKDGLFYAASQAHPHDIIITMDADNTHPAGLMSRMIRTLREGNDLVIASRYREGSAITGLSFSRRLLSLGASWMFRILFPIHGIRDYTCGYRAYRASILQSLIKIHGDQFISERGFSCMVDILLRLRPLSLVMTEVPLVLRYDQKCGQSKMKVLQTVGDTLRLALRRKLHID